MFQAMATPASHDKSALTIGKSKRIRCTEHLRFRSQPVLPYLRAHALPRAARAELKVSDESPIKPTSEPSVRLSTSLNRA